MRSVPPEFVNRLMLSDCVKAMRLLPSDCIPLTVTSPPYDGLRDYGGHVFDFFSVAEELYRITAPGGVVVWIIGEQIVKGAQTGSSSVQRTVFQETGFRLHDLMIMISRGTRLPQSNRYANAFQQAFILSKGKPRSANILRDRPNKKAGHRASGNVRLADGRIVQKWKDTIIPDIGRRTNVWEYTVGWNQTTKDHFAFDHPSLMPEKMAEDHILSWSRPNDLVLDPFCGAATTCKMALLNHRRYLGIEAHDEYFDIAAKRMKLAHAEYDQRLSRVMETL